MLKIISIVVAIPILIAAGLQGYLWYETREKARELSTALGPFVTLTYRGVHASLLGSVGLNGLKLAPAGTTDTFNIGSVRLHSSDILSLYDVKSRLDAGKIPESLSISVTDLRVGLYNDYMVQDETTPLFKPGASIGCGDVTYFGPEQLEEMGYSDIRLDIEVGYRFDQPNSRMNLYLDYDIKEMMRLSTDIGFAVNTPEGSVLELQASPPRLASFDFVLEDESYHERKKAYCADKSGDSPEDFVLNHIDLLAAQLRDQGLIVSDDLINAYREFLQQPDEIKLSAEPDAPLNPVELQRYNPSDIPRLLGLEVEVNGRAVNDLSIAFAAPQIPQADDGALEDGEQAATVEDLPNIEPADDGAAQTSTQPSATLVAPVEPVASKEFHPTPFNQLYRHVGATAQVKLKNHREYQGKIQSVSGEAIQIITRLRGGTATFYLTFDKIAEVGILY